MAVLEDLDEDEAYLFAILEDHSGLDQAEAFMVDESQPDACFRAHHHQVPWWRSRDERQIDQCARDTGKTLGIKLRLWSFPLRHAGQEAVITAPELVHLRPITDLVETQLLDTRLTREMLRVNKGGAAFTHLPFAVRFKNGSRIMGRLPNRDGRGVKGIHALQLETDEGQDFPKAGYTELYSTVKSGDGSMWRIHGVTRGVQDEFYRFTQPGSGWTVHRITQMHKPDWSEEKRALELGNYSGGKDDPDYRRNIMGLHGDATNMLFVMTRLMKCWQSGTPVWVIENGRAVARPIEDVAIGTRVMNAIGEGQVTNSFASRHSRVARLYIDGGEPVVCTPDHPILTARGWRPAGELREGDQVVRYEDMSAVWGADAWEGQDLLLDRLPQSRGCYSSVEDVPDMPRACEALPNLLQQDVRWDGQADAVAQRSVRKLRPPSRGERPDPILFPGVLAVGGAVDSVSGASLRLVSNPLCFGPEQAVLLGAVLREINWSDLRRHYRPAYIDRLCSVQHDVLSGVEEGEILFHRMRWPGARRGAPLAGSAMPALPPDISANSSRSSLLHGGMQEGRSTPQTVCQLWRDVPIETAKPEVLQSSVQPVGPTQTAEGEEPEVSHDEGRTGWATAPAVPPLAGAAGARPSLATSVLGESPWGMWGGDGLVFDRHRPSGKAVGGRGGRAISPGCVRTGDRSHQGRVADFARVDRVEVLERGDPEFDRLSGGQDWIVCYDLSVSGHPSFVVGAAQIITHNCVDDDKSSPYNTTEFCHIEITDTHIADLGEGGDVRSLLEFPNAHAKYDITWAGMDVGFTADPSEILIFAEYHPDEAERKALTERKKACPTAGVSRFKLLTRITLKRVTAPDQMKVILGCFDFYKLRAFGMDKTGNGLPLYQFVQNVIRGEVDSTNEFSEQAKAAAQKIKGYNFSAKVVVDLDEQTRVIEPDDPSSAAIAQNVLERSTDVLRIYVDTERMWLPWEDTQQSVIKEFSGQTFSYSKSNIDQNGRPRRVFSTGKFHALDGARMFAMAHSQEGIEAILGAKQVQEDVLVITGDDIFGY